MKGRNLLLGWKIRSSLSSRWLRNLCHSLSAWVSMLVRAADHEMKRERRYWSFMLAAACAFLSVKVMWSRPL